MSNYGGELKSLRSTKLRQLKNGKRNHCLMLVKDLMDDKKLDLDKPLLSIRRQQPATSRVSSEGYGNDDRRFNSSVCSIPQLPRYKSELKSGPIRDPGTVPFLWEKTPGSPKEDSKPQVLQNQVAPKLPPGRSSMANRIDSCRGNITESKETETEKSLFGSMRTSLNEEMEELVKGKEMTGQGKSSSTGDCDEEFVDARDTLSISGSSYLNCSMSYFTGSDDLDDNAARGNYSTDPQTQELMMERFLPAAKALASETPMFTPRKVSSPREPSQQVRHTALKPTLRYGPSFTKRYSLFGKDADGEEEEEEEEVKNEETYHHHNHFSMLQGCGMFPRLLKGSVFLNAVPGSSMRMRGSNSPAARTRPELSSTRYMNHVELSREVDIHSLSKRINEDLKDQTDSKNKGTVKTFQDDKGSDSGSLVGERTVYVDTVQNVGTPSSLSSGSQETGVVSRDGDEEIQMLILDSSLEDIKTITCEDVGTQPSETCNDPDKKLLRATTFEETIEKHTQLRPQQSATDPNDSEKQRVPTVKKLQKKCSLLPVTPPLPKSPTDSWLFRTLPSLSKNASEPSFLASTTNRQKHGFKVQPHNQELV